nr:MAG TPA: hypothetical protein [Caudoviricetes sp.]
MNKEELLNFLKENDIPEDLFVFRDEPSYSMNILLGLEKKYNISTKHVVNGVLTEKSLNELSGLTKDDHELWLDTYQTFNFFKGNDDDINIVPESTDLDYSISQPVYSISSEDQNIKKEVGFFYPTSFFFYSFLQIILFILTPFLG